MKNRFYLILETSGTIFWLLMDFCWMSGYKTMSSIIGAAAFLLLFGAFWAFRGRKVSERISNAVSFLWCLMNFLWMQSEYTRQEHMLVIAKGIFIIASILVIFVVILSRLEKGLPDIKRLKIK